MLEQINRLIDNDSLEVEKLNEIQEDIDYFVECMENDDCDGLDDDYNIYEDLQLDSLTGGRSGMGGSSDKDKDTETDTPSSSSSSSSSKAAPAVAITAIGKKAVVPNPPANSSSTVSPTKGSKTAKGTTKTSTKTVAPASAAVTSTPAPSNEGKMAGYTPPYYYSLTHSLTYLFTLHSLINDCISFPHPCTIIISYFVTFIFLSAVLSLLLLYPGATSSWANTAKLSTAPPTPPATDNQPSISTPPISSKLPAAEANNSNSNSNSAYSSSGNTSSKSRTVASKEVVSAPSGVSASKTKLSDRGNNASATNTIVDDINQLSSADALSRTNAPSSINSVVGGASKGGSSDGTVDQQQHHHQSASQAAPFMQQFSSQQTTSINQQQQPNEFSSSSLLSDNNGKGQQQTPMFGNSQEMQSISNLLKMSMMHTPPPSDVPTDHRQKGFTPKNPYTSHPSFPTQQPAVFENPAIFERLPIDSLFLAFYYQQGSYQQYLAARQLKKNSWRFHKKYMTWFQRHEEPKVTTDEYEEGTYVYFDYESGECSILFCSLLDRIIQYMPPSLVCCVHWFVYNIYYAL